MRIVQYLRKRYEAWCHQRAVKDALNSQGFLVYCECRTVLNLQPPIHSPDDGLYTWACPSCGKATTFDVTPPVPLKV